MAAPPVPTVTVSVSPAATRLLIEAKEQMRGNAAVALAKARQAERIIAATPNNDQRNRGIAEAQWLQGEAHLRLNDPDRAAPLISQALAAVERERVPTKLHADILLSRGQLDTLHAKVGSALADFQTAHNIFRALGETRSQAIALQQIASLYREADDFETAMKYDSQSAEIYKGDFGLEISNFNNRGNYLVENERFAEAEAQYRLALQVAGKMKSPILQARILRNIARTQLRAGKLAAADRTIATGMRLTSTGEGQAWRDQILAIAAQAALQRGQFQRAAAAISATFRGVDLTDTSLSFRDAHETAYETFSKVGRADLALRHLEALKRLDDKTAKLAASTNTALMAARFDTANKDAKIATLKANEALQSAAFEKARARQQRVVFIGVVIASLIGVGMLIFGLITIRRSRNEVRAANVDLAATNTALEKALAAKTEFLATTSHEIRTPLNGILGMTQVMLADQNLGAATRDRLTVVHGAGVTMRALVDDILDVAKMETGNLTLESVPLDLPATLREVSRLWEDQAQARGIAFVVDLDQSPVMIQGDPARLRQIVFNLLSNALKFTSTGTVTLKATTAEDGRLRLAVADTGIGIPADKLDIIFESFRQVDAGTTRQFGGTGLGLSICRNLARAMGGEVTVSSTPGEGSCFAVTLPLVLAAETAPITAGGRTGPALLIVDRNPISRSMLRALLAPRAGEVAFAGSADEAVRLIAQHAPQQVLIDDQTARAESNVDAALTLIAASSLVMRARVTLLWSATDVAETARLVATGVTQIITKPVSGVDLVDALYPQRAKELGSGVEQRLVSQAA
ncbi:ATP-binding protein [Sphingomonas sp. 28-62-11]|uniref:ATP-binding protein n=1 Tax=Sphingomonas sp. 28-62-11 TaxID=1970432 RepID=UPI0035A88C56